jgi:hypothetical protein
MTRHEIDRLIDEREEARAELGRAVRRESGLEEAETEYRDAVIALTRALDELFRQVKP